MKRILCVCLALLAASCSGLSGPVDEGFGSITGNWEADCCWTVLDAGANWLIRIVEDPGGRVTGTVTKREYGSFPNVRVYLGSVTGRRRGGRSGYRGSDLLRHQGSGAGRRHADRECGPPDRTGIVTMRAAAALLLLAAGV